MQETCEVLPKFLETENTSLTKIWLRRRVTPTGKKSLYILEFSFNNKKWYVISDRRITPRLDMRNFFPIYRNLMNRLWDGETITVLGSYDKQNKILTIHTEAK